jgi:hypothetical protein
LLRFLCRDSGWTEELGWVVHGASRVDRDRRQHHADHKKNPMATGAAGKGMAVAVELGRLADARLADGQEPLRVSLDAP